MADVVKYEVYHATDIKNTVKIINGNFKYKQNKQHWLGQGIYFFLDMLLAEDWALKRIDGYGTIHEPAYIKCIVEVDESRLLDLRFLDDYNFVKKCFDKFINSIIGKFDIKNSDYVRLRTLFFDYVKEQYNIRCIVAYIDERHNLSTKQDMKSVLKVLKFHIWKFRCV